MRLLLFILLFLLSSKFGFTQTLNPWGGRNGIRLASDLQNVEIEASYLLTSFPNQELGFEAFAMRFQWISAGLLYLKDKDKNISTMGIKVAYENTFNILSAQIGTDYIFTNTNNQIRLTPKIGISVFGFCTLYYGQKIHLLKNNDRISSKHNLSIQISTTFHRYN